MSNETEHVKITINFYADFIDGLKNELTTMGYSLDPTIKDEEILIRFFNIQKRLISPTPRKILVSREFSCPHEYKVAIEQIKNNAENGVDLTPHLHRKIKSDPDFNNPLLNDWGIHHLHLGTSIEADGFVTRTGPVLFARVTRDTLYLIDIMDHGKRHQPWTKRKLIEIIHNNWPDSIKQYKIDGISLAVNFSETEINDLRNAGVQPIIQLDDGSIYAPLGGGLATSKKSIEAVTRSNHFINLISHVENHVKSNALEIMSQFENVNIEDGLCFRFVKMSGKNISIFEEKNQKTIKLELQD